MFFTRRLPPEHYAGLAIVLTALLLYLLVLALGSTYGGIRHALPVIVLLAILGGFAIQMGFASNSMFLKAAVATALVAAAASALPVMRPWEYFNEIIGSKKNAYLYFSDEGVDLGQRGKELAEYYHRVLEPSGEVPILFYGPIGEPEKKAPSLRDAAPSVRFGNLMVFRGTCACGAILAPGIYEDAISKIYAKKPDLETGERLLRESVSLDPSAFFVSIELGNVCMKRGSRENALHAYSDALQHAHNDPKLRRSIEEQIKKLSSEPLDQVPELRNPFLE